jgi:hypothetical protein
MSETIVGAGRRAGLGHSEPHEPTEAAPGHLPRCEPVGVSRDAEEVAEQVPDDDDDRRIAIAVQDDAAWSRLATDIGRPGLAALSGLGSGKREDELECPEVRLCRCTQRRLRAGGCWRRPGGADVPISAVSPPINAWQAISKRASSSR